MAVNASIIKSEQLGKEVKNYDACSGSKIYCSYGCDRRWSYNDTYGASFQSAPVSKLGGEPGFRISDTGRNGICSN